MPTPVSSARQCLTDKAATALDDAVSVARRRGHSQTTSLHMVSSLLSLPNSSLREACTRIRNNAYSTRVQFKALELSLSVSLDRMPQTSSKNDEPPISNSLMAAIKRSQASQRRQPENFSFYQQQQYCSSSTVPVVKVELRNLIISIVDDPLVSRVFGEAGVRSSDVKMSMIRPGNTSSYPVFSYGSRYKRHNTPLFLCSSENGIGSKSFSFPFMGCFSSEDSLRRVGEVMLRGKKRNPLLMGVSANDVLSGFLESVERKSESVLHVGLSGLSVVCVKDDILRFVNGDCDERLLELRFKEVERVFVSGEGNGVLVSFGDLKVFSEDGVGIEGLRYLVGRFSKLIEVYDRKLWLIGAAVTYDVYFKFLNKFPSIEEDWDMEILPITSLKFPVGGSYPRSSLMESFVPLGGFFSMPSDTRSASTNATLGVVRCNMCNEKYEQEVATLSNGGPSASVTEQCQSSLPLWMQNAEPISQNGLPTSKGKNDMLLLNAKIASLQKKWDDICHHHHPIPFYKDYAQRQLGYHCPQVLGFQVAEGKNGTAVSESRNHSNASQAEQGNNHVISNVPTGLQHSGSIIADGQMSPTSVTSVTTDLGLGTISSSTCKEQEKTLNQSRSELSGSFSSNAHNYRHSDIKDPKLLYRTLVERVSWQEEAVISVTKAISQCQSKLNRNDLWIDLQGPDALGKKKLAVALAEILYGSTESIVYVDLSFANGKNNLFDSKMKNKYEFTMRGTVVDYLVEKLSKKPCVVFIERVDKADLVVQNSLLNAVKTGRLMDLRGREVNITNSVFLTTTRFESKEESGKYSEEDILNVKGKLIQILIRCDLNDDLTDRTQECYDVNFVNKRKLNCESRSTNPHGNLELRKKAQKSSNSYLDLNFPANKNDSSVESDSDSSSDNPKSWLENFSSQIDERVVFRPFDYEMLAEKLYKKISACLNEAGLECDLEIEPALMHQFLAASCLFDNKQVDDWIQIVIKKGFEEAMENFSIDARSVVKLVACERSLEDWENETLLPSRIIVN